MEIEKIKDYIKAKTVIAEIEAEVFPHRRRSMSITIPYAIATELIVNE